MAGTPPALPAYRLCLAIAVSPAGSVQVVYTQAGNVIFWDQLSLTWLS